MNTRLPGLALTGCCLAALTACGPSGSLPVVFKYTQNARVQQPLIYGSGDGSGCRLDLALLNHTKDRLNNLDARVSFNTGERSGFSFQDVRSSGNGETWFTSRDPSCMDLRSIQIDITRCDLENHSEGDCIKLVKFKR